jgi:hypothetical protein
MRILTYKRTHIGDPDPGGRFGIYDCMGRIRLLDFNAVIGVGGLGAEPRSYKIDRKVNWVGVGARKQWRSQGAGVVVTFEEFRLLEEQGPLLHQLAPRLARQMYEGRVRFLLDGYRSEEQAEAEAVLEWVLSQPAVRYRPGRHSSAKGGCKRKCSPCTDSEASNNGT